MKITCEREKLLGVFQTAATVAPSRSPKPILQNIKMEVSDDSVLLSATDMEIGIRIEVPGMKIQNPGSAVLPKDRFGSILRECQDEKLSIEADVQGIVVKGEHSQFKLPAENPDEFPHVASFEAESYQEISARLFRELIRRTLFATDTESSRYALGGVLLEFDGDRITAVGTDGRRLAKMDGPAQTVGDAPSSDSMTIVPTRSMQIIERTLSDAEAEIRVAASNNDVLVKTPRATIFSRLVEGRFPKWRDVLPERKHAIRLDLTVGPLLSALRQAAIVTDDESRGIDFTFGEGSLVLVSSTADVGDARVEIPIPYDGTPTTVTLDHRFVADFLKVLEPEKAFHLEIEDSEQPALFTTDDAYSYVVMPLARDR